MTILTDAQPTISSVTLAKPANVGQFKPDPACLDPVQSTPTMGPADSSRLATYPVIDDRELGISSVKSAVTRSGLSALDADGGECDGGGGCCYGFRRKHCKSPLIAFSGISR